MVLLLASLLLDQVGRGLVAAKTRSSLVEAQSGVAQAQAEVYAASGDNTDAVLRRVVAELSGRGATGELYDVLLVGSPTTTAYSSGRVRPSDVPPELARRVRAAQSTVYLFAPMPFATSPQDALVVASPLTTLRGTYTLYHLFPLTAEEQTLALVRRTAAVIGVLLVLLLALIVGIVTRAVVSPVQLAARTAELLASGRLEERMQRTGEDELARLASSFNSMAEALQQQIGQLEDLSRLQRRFVSDVSHELRTPLTTIRMAADVLYDEREAFAPHVARSAELLHAQLDRFEEMLVDLLEISRYDAGAASIVAERVDLVPLVSRVLAQTRPLAERKGSTLTVTARGPVVAEVDAIRIERVLRNLVVNAVEHGEGSPVEVSLAGGPDAVAVVVRDFGVGLRPGEAELAFTRFWRADPSRARTTGGTGLGLAIALEDVRLHGGDLEAWGEPGVGASFRVTLPRHVGAAPGPSPLPLHPDLPTVLR